MKYILAEQIKYILREDVSGPEWEGAIKIVQSYKNKPKINELIDELRSTQAIDNKTANEINKIAAIAGETEDSTDRTNDEVKSDKYKKALKDMMDLLRSRKINISKENSEFAELAELSNKDEQLTTEEMNRVGEIFNILKGVRKGKAEEPSSWTTVDSKEKDIIVNELLYMLDNAEKVENRLNELKSKLDSIDKNKKNAYEKLIKEINNTIALEDINSDHKNYKKLITLSNLSKKIIEAIQIKDSTNDQDLKYEKGMDWAEALKKSSNREEVWDNYYKVEWGENADFVKKLGSAVVVELNHFGFSEKVNPFITFIKTLISKTIKVNDTAYNAIHDAYVNHYINSNDLRNAKDKILFCDDLYTHSGGEILEYLQRRHEIIQKPKESTTDGYKTDSILNTTYNLFNSEYHLPDANSEEAKNIGVDLPLSKLNTLSKIEENIVTVFGEAEEKTTKTKIDDAWYDSFEKEGKANLTSYAKAAICYVLIYCTVNSLIDESKLEEYKTKFNKIDQNEFNKFGSINSDYYKKMIKRFANTKIDRSNFDNILTTLYDRYVDKKTD